jgi:murein DD-endopeptidase MepM/ murein hydrolase activator NlpD
VTEPNAQRRLHRLAGAGTGLALVFGVAAMALQAPRRDQPIRPEASPGLILFNLRLAAPDPMTDTAQAGLDAARAELAAGLMLSEQLSQGRAAGVDLLAPTTGPILERFGSLQAGGLRSQGLTFQSPSGGAVRAPASGDVLFAGTLEGWGEAVILQATPRGQVVLAGPFTASVQTGDAVRQGQALGQAADRGSAVRLYIELRDLGQPIDPQPWLRPETP